VDILVPDLGDFADVEVIEILVKPGDRVEVEDALITLETDKATMDVPAPSAGIVKSIAVKPGATVSSGDLIVVLEGDAAQASESAPTQTAEPQAVAGPVDDRPEDDKTVRQPKVVGTESSGTVTTTLSPGDATVAAVAPTAAPAAGPPRTPISEAGFARAHASPSIRRLARELGVDLGSVKGSGRKGRVTADDVKAFVKRLMQGGFAPRPALPEVPVVDFARFGEIEMKSLSRIQKISGPRLHASWVNVPHVTQHDDADITELEQTRRNLKVTAEERGIKLTPLAFIVRACALVLAEFPNFRSSLDAAAENLIFKHYTHIGFAADTPNGLVVPVIRDADKKDIYELASALADLSGRAREGRLQGTDMQGGVFTISSLGGIGGNYVTPIINAPEVAILGVSRNYWKPRYNGKKFEPRLALPLSLSYDHRVIDGAQAARFIVRLGEVLAQVDRLVEAIP
jgi:pyruvate dehydrogenase E2 component (dihydrolipoamide acetyltransferase)